MHVHIVCLHDLLVAAVHPIGGETLSGVNVMSPTTPTTDAGEGRTIVL
jgi:hypothetical protein